MPEDGEELVEEIRCFLVHVWKSRFRIPLYLVESAQRRAARDLVERVFGPGLSSEHYALKLAKHGTGAGTRRLLDRLTFALEDELLQIHIDFHVIPPIKDLDMMEQYELAKAYLASYPRVPGIEMMYASILVMHWKRVLLEHARSVLRRS